MSQTSPSQNTITTECCICFQNTRVYDTKDNWECTTSHSGKVCKNCTDILKNEESNCPMCRASLTRRYNSNILNHNQLIFINSIINNISYNINDETDIISNMIEATSISMTDLRNSNIIVHN